MRRRAPTGHVRDSGPTCDTLARTTLALPDVSKAALSQGRMLLRSALQRSKESYETTELFVAMEQALEDINSRLNNPGSVADSGIGRSSSGCRGQGVVRGLEEP